MARKQSSSDVSSIAGKYVRMTNDEMAELARDALWLVTVKRSRYSPSFFRDIRKLAASVLSQKEPSSK